MGQRAADAVSARAKLNRRSFLGPTFASIGCQQTPRFCRQPVSVSGANLPRALAKVL